MSLFQQSVIKKYLQELDNNFVNSAFDKFHKHFGNTEIQSNIREAKEEQYQEGFLRELFVDVFGYTLYPQTNYNLITEQKNEKDSKKADGAILQQVADATRVIAVIELKGTDTTDLSKVEVQAFSYKNNQKDCKYVITSNFEKLRFYIDNAIDFEEFNLFNLTKDRFNLLYLCLAKENLLNGIPQKIKEASVSQEENITKKLYSDYSAFKRLLFQNICVLNPEYDKLTLFQKTQKLLDRFLFIFFAEDRLLLPPNSIREIIKQWEQLKDLDNYTPLYDRFKKYFGYMNTGFKGKQYEIFAYNGGLFAPNEILDNLKIDDQILFEHTLKLSNYDYDTEVDVNILGHIFEHSLNEIEEIQSELEGKELDKSKTKRKKDGVFYTPKYITKYIVENTVGALCTEKKKELEINEEEIVISKRKDKKKELIEKIDSYRNWLLKLTICDPACGSGAFLNQALDYLLIEHKKLDELKARITNSPMILSDIENSVLENNIFGVDLNEEAVEIAKLSLWLKTAQKGRKLSILTSNIKCGNSLIDDKNIAGEKAFNWKNEFPEIFANGGFDVIIGNPPYVRQESFKNIKDFLHKVYPEIYEGTADLFVYFFKKGLEILNINGYFGFIVSNKFVRSGYGKKLRNYLSTNYAIQSFIDKFESKVFVDAGVDPCIIIMKKEIPQAFHKIQVNYNNETMQNQLSENGWSLESNDINTFIQKIRNKGLLIKDWKNVNIYFGIKSGLTELFIVDKKTKEDFIIQEPLSKEIFKPLLRGRDIKKYVINWSNLYLIDNRIGIDLTKFPILLKHFEKYKDDLLKRTDYKEGLMRWYNLRPCNYYNEFEKPKIIYPDISENGGFYWDDENFYFNNTVYMITNAPKYWTGILNSKCISWYYKQIASGLGKTGIRYFKQFVELIPIIEPEIYIQDKICNCVSQQQSSYKRLHEFKTKFINLLTSKYNKLKITNKFENWSGCDFKEFSKELEKQKIKLSLAEQSEWLEFFEKEKTKVIELQNEMNKTDKEIDKIVYKLYELTEEEIKIIETV